MYTQSIHEVVKYKRSKNLRGKARHFALNIVSKWGNITGRTARDLSHPRIHFVYLHYLFPEEVQNFRNLLTKLAETHTFISYSEAVKMLVANKPIDKPYLSFSSDDGFKNNLKMAEILAEFGAKACFFVCSDIVGETDFETCRLFSASRLNYPPMEFMDWDDLKQLQKNGHEIGCHTRWHPNLAECDPSKLYDQIGGAKAIIEDKVGPVKHFAWPYGLFQHFSDTARRVVFKAGFASCASAERGAHVVHAANIHHEDICIRRDQLIANWPVSHNLYFLARSANAAAPENVKYDFDK